MATKILWQNLVLGWGNLYSLSHPFFVFGTSPVLYYQDVRRGLNSIRRICREYKINGVFGPIIELLDCEERFFTAVEVTAGNRYA